MSLGNLKLSGFVNSVLPNIQKILGNRDSVLLENDLG